MGIAQSFSLVTEGNYTRSEPPYVVPGSVGHMKSLPSEQEQPSHIYR